MLNKFLNFRSLWALFMLVIYFGMSFLLIFTKLFDPTLETWMRISIGIVFFVYGIYRAYRMWKYNK